MKFCLICIVRVFFILVLVGWMGLIRGEESDAAKSVNPAEEVSRVNTGRYELTQTYQSFGGPKVVTPKVGKRPVLVKIKGNDPNQVSGWPGRRAGVCRNNKGQNR